MYIKALDNNLMCRGIQYKIGQTYKVRKNSPMSKKFYCHKKLEDTIDWLGMPGRYCEIELSGDVIQDGELAIVNEITIIRELFLDELIELDDTGEWCMYRASNANDDFLLRLKDEIIKKDQTGLWCFHFTVKYQSRLSQKVINELQDAVIQRDWEGDIIEFFIDHVHSADKDKLKSALKDIVKDKIC